MPLDVNFPTNPHDNIVPEVRWFPGPEELGEQGREKLLPPLINSIRKEVQIWRSNGYPNISSASQSLLKYWFQTDHIDEFKYYFAQQESVESIIYLYEHQQVRNPSDLLKYDSSGILIDSMFEESWLRLVIKQATGTGKTKVLCLLIAWCYFHKEFNQDSRLSKNFLLLAPNTIVLDRLKDDIDGLRIFANDPIIPPTGYDGRNWDFQPRVHIQDNIHSISDHGNIFLTNIQRFAKRRTSVSSQSTADYFLGARPVTSASDNQLLVRDVVKNMDDIIVLNDEAHHIHDKKLAWFQTIEDIHNNLKQKDSGLPLQIDVTATPKDQRGNIFPQTISDYPLVEAIKQQVVKVPILPDEASRGKLDERPSVKFSERWKDYIDLGVTVWEQDYNKHKKLHKKALLFIMVDDTTNCDDVKEYLEQTYPILENGTFIIHTNKEGQINESGSTARDKRELLELRNLVNQVDSENNNIKAIVSVLMLKEGWDVKNVTTVVGLRPFTSKSNILPEQALGRGLRRMYPNQEIEEELNVLGTPAFMDFVESIKSEGVNLEKRPMNAGSQPAGPAIIEIDHQKDTTELDMELPVLTPRIYRTEKDYRELNIESFEFEPITIKEFTAAEQRNFVFRDLIDEEVAREVQISDNIHINANSITMYFVRSIMNELRHFGGEEILYTKLREFMTEHLFGKAIDLEDPNIVRNLSETNVRYTIKETFKKYINALQITDKGTSEVRHYIKISAQPPFSISRVQESLPAKKSIFNKIVGDSNFELLFASFLDAAVDVDKFIKNYIQLGWSIEYVNHEGGISTYYPDFVVHLNNGEKFVVETKGAEHLDDPLKIERLKIWCEDASKATNESYRHLYVKQEDWDSLGLTPNSFSEIITIFTT